ncbi:MAG: hypothetical protein H6925_06990 [Holosporaceae bacterium]|nr:MAG: hypothetical protein H6925_06990 [Holosporaceae bacterium]
MRLKDWWACDIPSQKGFYNFDYIQVNHFSDTRVAFEAFKKGRLTGGKMSVFQIGIRV